MRFSVISRMTLGTALVGTGLLLAAGCGPRFEHIRVDRTVADTLQQAVPAFTAEELAPGSFQVAAAVTATSCMNRLWDPRPSRRDAIDQLRVKARRLGASALLNVTCEKPEGVDLGKNCWSSLRCHAAAIVMSSPDPEPLPARAAPTSAPEPAAATAPAPALPADD